LFNPLPTPFSNPRKEHKAKQSALQTPAKYFKFAKQLTNPLINHRVKTVASI
jgi:hypothetical protein